MKHLLILTSIIIFSINVNAQSEKKDSIAIIRLKCVATKYKAPLPLYVVDGKLRDTGYLNKLDKNEIESIEVLKDDKALVLYGKEATNGVILIKTKQQTLSQ